MESPPKRRLVAGMRRLQVDSMQPGAHRTRPGLLCGKRGAAKSSAERPSNSSNFFGSTGFYYSPEPSPSSSPTADPSLGCGFSLRGEFTSGYEGDGLLVLSLVAGFWSSRELWGICHALDKVTPRRVVVHSVMDEAVRLRLMMLMQPGGAELKAFFGPFWRERLYEQQPPPPPLEDRTRAARHAASTKCNAGGVPVSRRGFPIPHVRLGTKVCKEIGRSLGYKKLVEVENRVVQAAVRFLPPGLKHLQFGDYYCRYEGGEFSREVEGGLPEGLESIQYGRFFNAAVVLPASTKKVTFSVLFNKPLVLPEAVEMCEVGVSFNHPLKLPSSLRRLDLGYKFNHPLVLPEGLRKITFGNEFNQHVELPSTLVRAYFGHAFNQLLELPSKLEKLSFGHSFNTSIRLVDSIRELSFGSGFKQKVERFPSRLERVRFGRSFHHPLPGPFPDSVVEIEFDDSDFDHPLEGLLPPRLERLAFTARAEYDHPLGDLPKTLERLQLGSSLSHPVVLPEGLRVLRVNGDYASCGHPLHLPGSIRKVYCRDTLLPLLRLPERGVRQRKGEEDNREGDWRRLYYEAVPEAVESTKGWGPTTSSSSSSSSSSSTSSPQKPLGVRASSAVAAAAVVLEKAAVSPSRSIGSDGGTAAAAAAVSPTAAGLAAASTLATLH